MADKVVSHAFSHGFRPEHSQRLAAYWAEALGVRRLIPTCYGDETSVVRMHSGNGQHEEMDRRAIACFDLALADVGLNGEGRLPQSHSTPPPPSHPRSRLLPSYQTIPLPPALSRSRRSGRSECSACRQGDRLDMQAQARQPRSPATWPGLTTERPGRRSSFARTDGHRPAATARGRLRDTTQVPTSAAVAFADRLLRRSPPTDNEHPGHGRGRTSRRHRRCPRATTLFQPGWMFWLCRKRLSGSWRRLVSTRRS